MDTTKSLVEGVIIMLALILLAVVLRKTGLLKKEDSGLFSQIVLKVTLPAVIFFSLSMKHFDSDYLIMSGIMALIEIFMIILAWVVATLLRFKPGEKGALMLVSAFGMTAMLGYPIIRQAFPGNMLAMQEAVVTSELGVGLLLFILGPLIAMYYGEDSTVDGGTIVKSVKKFFVSPIFIAVIAGIAVSFLPLNHNNEVFATFTRFVKLVGHANVLMVALTIGLLVEFRNMKHLSVFLLLAIVLKLFVKPLLAVWLTEIPHFTEMMREIVLIETALPSAILTVVFAKQYNCRPDLVSAAIMVTLVISVATVSLLFVTFF
jgi:predicted permease